MTLLLVPLLLALVAVLVVPRMKARQSASDGSSKLGGGRLRKRSEPSVRKFVL